MLNEQVDTGSLKYLLRNETSKNYLPNQENMLGKSHDKKIEKTLFLRVLKNYQRKTSYLQSFH